MTQEKPMTTNNALTALDELRKSACGFNKAMRNGEAWDAYHTVAALLDAPETVDGLDEALKREGVALRVSELSYDDIEIFIEAARLYAHSRQSAGVPPGWKMVPIEPTENMVAAGNGCDFPVCKDIYDAMISAAPKTYTDNRQNECASKEHAQESAVDVEAIKREVEIHTGKRWEKESKCGEVKHHHLSGLNTQAISDIIDHLHQRGYFGQTVDKESGE